MPIFYYRVKDKPESELAVIATFTHEEGKFQEITTPQELAAALKEKYGDRLLRVYTKKETK